MTNNNTVRPGGPEVEETRWPEYAPRVVPLERSEECDEIMTHPGEPIFGEVPEAACADEALKPE